MRRRTIVELQEFREWTRQRGGIVWYDETTMDGTKINYGVADLSHLVETGQIMGGDAVVSCVVDTDNYEILISRDIPSNMRTLYAWHELIAFGSAEGVRSATDADLRIESYLADGGFYSVLRDYYLRRAEVYYPSLEKRIWSSPGEYESGDVNMVCEAIKNATMRVGLIESRHPQIFRKGGGVAAVA